MTTRPITDRVKESLFSILDPMLEGAVVGDLFCGTGSMGLEALSRGVRHAVMVDRDRDALRRLRQNIGRLAFEKQTTVRYCDVFKVGVPEFQIDGDMGICNLLFVDPPYTLSEATGLNSPLGKLLGKISMQIPTGAVLVVRHGMSSVLKEVYGAVEVYDRRCYGRMGLTFLRKDDD